MADCVEAVLTTEEHHGVSHARGYEQPTLAIAGPQPKNEQPDRCERRGDQAVARGALGAARLRLGHTFDAQDVDRQPRRDRRGVRA